MVKIKGTCKICGKNFEKNIKKPTYEDKMYCSDCIKIVELYASSVKKSENNTVEEEKKEKIEDVEKEDVEKEEDVVDVEIINESKEVKDVMTNEWILEQLRVAKEALDRVPQLGEDAFNVCDGILSNLKSFVTEDEAYRKIIDFEEKLYRDFKLKEREAREKLKGVDYLTSFNLGGRYYMNLRQWKSSELLNMWNRLVKDYDL